MVKLSSSRGIRIDVPVLSVSWSFKDHSVNIQALRKGLIEHEASDTGGVPRWQSSCPDRLAEATKLNFASCVVRQTRSLGALVLCSICNMLFVNYFYHMVVDTQFNKFSW